MVEQIGQVIASPSAYSSNCVMRVDYDGSVNSNGYSLNTIGFRPVVSLKSGISVTKNDDGSVTLK